MKKALSLLTLLMLLIWSGCRRTCETACLNNGTCDNGICVCTPGHWGAACQNDSCVKCLNRYVEIYIDEYFNNLDTLTNGFCEDCVTWAMVDTAHDRAERKARQLNCIDATPTTTRIDVSQIIRNRQYQPVSDSFTAGDKNYYIALGAWLDFNPVASPGRIALPGCK
ncbi:MAG TPA: hypothetical protein VK154_08790 [Chitinophagales bacterium]|nr:hypothetical protein [Chitinophagales bacterium]